MACVLVLVLIVGFTVLEVRFDNGTFRDGPKSSFLKNDCRSSDVLNNSGVLPVVVMSVGAAGAAVGVRLMNSTASSRRGEVAKSSRLWAKISFRSSM